MRPAQFLSSALLFSTLSTAWSWQDSDALKEIEGVFRRQNDDSDGATSVQMITLGSKTTSGGDASSGDASAQQTEISSGKASGSTAAPTTGGSSGSNTAAPTTGGSSGSNNDKATTTRKHTTTAIDPRLPAGGVSMITPAALAAAKYYKIGDYVTFAWNYTSLSITPSAIDILASCSANQATYTIAMNQSIAGSTGAVTWDTNEYQATASIPLLTEKYTLIIHDAAKDVSSTPEAGKLGTVNQFTFGMYVPQQYTPMSDWVCATCSGAMSDMERQTLGFLIGMVVLTVTSFTLFASGAGVF